MTALFHDVHKAVDHQTIPFQGECTNVWKLLYADDTMVMGNKAREINIILKQIEIESDKYNLKSIKTNASTLA